MSAAMYTLFYRGEAQLSCDDLPYLERGLQGLESTRGTYIKFNETGVKQYETDNPKTTQEETYHEDHDQDDI